jgi:hypothetical protein
VRLDVRVEGQERVIPLPGEGRELVAFMSFAVSRGFGATHPMIALADRLHDDHGVRLGPLTSFYDGTVEDAEDAEKLELAWQPAAPLSETLAEVVRVLDEDAIAASLARRAEAPALRDQAYALLDAIARLPESTRVRLEYRL